jgi:serine/threonine-protein kinase RsbW
MSAKAPATAAPAVTGRVFPGEAGQVGAARRLVAGLLDGCPAAGDALVCVSELATNAVLHSRSGRPGGRFSVCVALQPGSVRVAVADEGGPWRQQRTSAGRNGDRRNGDRQSGDGQSGRGLLIVRALASRWGRDEGGAGRTVWFEMDW